MERVKSAQEGVIVGADINQEWLLEWWWGNYSRWNSHPVTFIDFGLSLKKKQWCREKGELVPLLLADLFIKDREEVGESLASQWEAFYGDHFWTSRKAWFKKPHACLKSPYQKTIWIDLDCEILGPIAPLFKACEQPSGIALAKDQTCQTYNSGVIAFRKEHPLILEWAKLSLEKTDSFRGDQDLLSEIIDQQNIDVSELSPFYNWNIGYGENPNVVIYHWVGDMGKWALRKRVE